MVSHTTRDAPSLNLVATPAWPQQADPFLPFIGEGAEADVSGSAAAEALPLGAHRRLTFKRPLAVPYDRRQVRSSLERSSRACMYLGSSCWCCIGSGRSRAGARDLVTSRPSRDFPCPRKS
jgi:hypothetical protein